MVLKLSNKSLNFIKNPINIIRDFSAFKIACKNLMFEGSIYENGTPGTGKTKYRRKFRFRKFDRLEKKLFDDTNILKGREIAIHSRVYYDNKIQHIPLIDFEYKLSDLTELINSLEKIQEKYNYDIYIFKSGTSYHGYLDALFDEKKWLIFLGSLLLLNSKGGNNIIDSRWVAHSLEQGFSSLRISKNTDFYKQPPIYLDKFSKIKIKKNSEISSAAQKGVCQINKKY